MVLEQDEFVVSFDPTVVNHQKLLLASKEAGFPARLVTDSSKPAADSTFFRDAFVRARDEKKPMVIDFTASWCAPCQRMLRGTFPDEKVAPLLERCVFIKVDADEHPSLAQQYDVVGLPDVRLLTSDGREVRRFRDFQTPEAFATALTELLQKEETFREADDATDLIALSADESEIKEAFDRDVGSVRLLLVLSPT